jgi:hypothetical protein
LFPALPAIDYEQRHVVADSNSHKVYVNPELDPSPNDTTSSSVTSSVTSSSTVAHSNNDHNHNRNHRHDKHNSIGGKEHHTNISLYAVGSNEVGSDLGGLLDSTRGGWGDHYHHIGVSAKEASSVSTRHIIEQAIHRYNFSVVFKCASIAHSSSLCYTKPFVSHGDEKLTALLTMHALRTNPAQYRSVKCE